MSQTIAVHNDQVVTILDEPPEEEVNIPFEWTVKLDEKSFDSKANVFQSAFKSLDCQGLVDITSAKYPELADTAFNVGGALPYSIEIDEKVTLITPQNKKHMYTHGYFGLIGVQPESKVVITFKSPLPPPHPPSGLTGLTGQQMIANFIASMNAAAAAPANSQNNNNNNHH